MVDGIQEESLELLSSGDRVVQTLRQALDQIGGRTIEEFTETAYAAVDAVLRRIGTNREQIAEVQALVPEVVESIRNLLYTSSAPSCMSLNHN